MLLFIWGMGSTLLALFWAALMWALGPLAPNIKAAQKKGRPQYGPPKCWTHLFWNFNLFLLQGVPKKMVHFWKRCHSWPEASRDLIFLHDLDKCLEDLHTKFGLSTNFGCRFMAYFRQKMRKYAGFVKNGRKKFFSNFFK